MLRSIREGKRKKLVQANGGEIIPLKTTHQRYADVFSDLGFPIDLSYPIYPIKSKPSPLVQGLLDINKKYIGIAAFAAHHSKQYPLEKIKEILKYFSESGAYQILLFGGGQKEVEALDQLEKEYKNTINLAGKFNLQTELEIIEQLDVMLSMDSGNGHLAALFDVPVLTLWGNTHPYAGFVPFNQPESHQIVADRGQFPLIPTSIYGNKMPEGYDKVMHSIPAELVIDKIKSLID